MDWNKEQINTYNQIEILELVAIQLQQKSNSFKAYDCVTFRAYKKCYKELILLVTGDFDTYPRNYWRRDIVFQA